MIWWFCWYCWCPSMFDALLKHRKWYFLTDLLAHTHYTHICHYLYICWDRRVVFIWSRTHRNWFARCELSRELWRWQRWFQFLFAHNNIYLYPHNITLDSLLLRTASTSWIPNKFHVTTIDLCNLRTKTLLFHRWWIQILWLKNGNQMQYYRIA